MKMRREAIRNRYIGCMEPVRIAFLGAGRRASYLYARLIAAMGEWVTLVGVWSRSEASAKRLGDEHGVPWYTSMERLKRETGAVAGIVSVSYSANGAVGREAVENGFHILTETPIAHDLATADAIVRIAEEAGLKVEVAEQFHRRPDEQIKLALIQSGLFGEVLSSFNDFAGHGYHGVSVMRSYLGFDRRPLRVSGSVHQYTVAGHRGILTPNTDPRVETQEHGIVEMEGDRVGIFHWTSIGYDSAARWWRGSRFYAERGMAVTSGTYNEPRHELTVIGPDAESAHRTTLHRELERCDGGALVRYVAYPGLPDAPPVEWRNPFGQGPAGSNPEWHDDEIGVAGCIVSLVDAIRQNREPSYGARQGLIDQEVILALRASAAQGGAPVDLPMPRE